MRPGAAGPVTSDAPGCCEVTTLPLTKKLPSSSRVSGPPSVPAAALHERDAARSAKYAFMAGNLLCRFGSTPFDYRVGHLKGEAPCQETPSGFIACCAARPNAST